MQLLYKVEGIDCANCAAKLERAIAKLAGVQEANLNFMTGRLSLQVADESVQAQVLAVIQKREPDASVTRL